MYDKIVIVVVLYNILPKDYSYIINEYKEIKLILVDNTPNRDHIVIDEQVDYIPLGSNMGIAYALNKGCRYAIEKYHAEWVLTLDQDSDVPLNMIQAYVSFINSNPNKIGIVCPLMNVYHGECKRTSDTIIEIDAAITSGSLINMEAYQMVGGFKDELFIDEVDFEFSYNLRSHNFHIYQLNNVLLQHQVGNTTEFRFMGKHLFYVLHHGYLRHYYMQRNSLYVRNLYADKYPHLKLSFVQMILPFLKILLYEDDKFRKILYRYRGYCDYKHHVLGKCKY